MTGELLFCSVRESAVVGLACWRGTRGFPVPAAFIPSWVLVGRGRRWSLANPVGDQQVAPPVMPSGREVDMYLGHK